LASLKVFDRLTNTVELAGEDLEHHERETELSE
jgi:hypothetical protein